MILSGIPGSVTGSLNSFLQPLMGRLRYILRNQSNSILNDLYQGTHVDDDRRRRLLALFHVTIKDQAAVRPEIAGRPVYFGLGMNEQKIVRMKPQNPLTNMPLVSAY